MVEPTIKEKFLKYRETAKEKGRYEQKYLNEKEIILTVARILPTTSSLTLAEAMKNDLRTMPFYDAVASWCDTEVGLAVHFPQAILQVASSILPLETETPSV